MRIIIKWFQRYIRLTCWDSGGSTLGVASTKGSGDPCCRIISWRKPQIGSTRGA